MYRKSSFQRMNTSFHDNSKKKCKKWYYDSKVQEERMKKFKIHKLQDTLDIRYSFFQAGDVNTATSPIFFPMRDFPRGDSLDILFSRGSASAEPTIKKLTSSSNS